jgi:site-specific recombinase
LLGAAVDSWSYLTHLGERLSTHLEAAHWTQLVWALAGVAAIGLINIAVSIALALRLALASMT